MRSQPLCTPRGADDDDVPREEARRAAPCLVSRLTPSTDGALLLRSQPRRARPTVLPRRLSPVVQGDTLRECDASTSPPAVPFAALPPRPLRMSHGWAAKALSGAASHSVEEPRAASALEAAQLAKRVCRSFSASTRHSSAGSSVLTAPTLRRTLRDEDNDDADDDATRAGRQTSCLSSQGLSHCTVDSRATANKETDAGQKGDAAVTTCDEVGQDDLLPGCHVVCEELLRRLTHRHELNDVSALELRVDVEGWVGVDRLSRLLPRLTTLKLSHSRIPQLRLLGARYTALRYLWLSSCHLSDLRGVGACAPRLRELYVAFNRLTDLAPLMDLAETLQVLDVEANELAEVSSLCFVLATLRQLTTLTLQGNPVVFDDALWTESTDNEVHENHLVLNHDECHGVGYHATVRALMPQLRYLDDAPVARRDAGERAVSRTKVDKGDVVRPRDAHVDPLDAALVDELRLVQDCLRECDYDDVLDAAVAEDNGARRPAVDAVPRDASTLTTGDVLAGSAIASLRRRLVTSATAPTTRDDTPAAVATACEVRAAASADVGTPPQHADEDDSGTSEDEWERFSRTLTRQRLGSAGSTFARSVMRECARLSCPDATGGEDVVGDERLPSRAHYMQLALREMAAERDASDTHERGCVSAMGMSMRDFTASLRRPSTSRGGPPSRRRTDSQPVAERDALDALVRREVARTRAQIAKARRDDRDALDGNTFLAHRDRFEVIALNSIPEHQL